MDTRHQRLAGLTAIAVYVACWLFIGWTPHPPAQVAYPENAPGVPRPHLQFTCSQSHHHRTDPIVPPKANRNLFAFGDLNPQPSTNSLDITPNQPPSENITEPDQTPTPSLPGIPNQHLRTSPSMPWIFRGSIHLANRLSALFTRGPQVKLLSIHENLQPGWVIESIHDNQVCFRTGHSRPLCFRFGQTIPIKPHG